MQDVFIRTETKDYDTWFKVFNSPTGPSREEYGIKTAGVYRDTTAPNTVVIQFEVEDMKRVGEFMALPEFAKISEEAGVLRRQVFLGTPV